MDYYLHTKFLRLEAGSYDGIPVHFSGEKKYLRGLYQPEERLISAMD